MNDKKKIVIMFTLKLSIILLAAKNSMLDTDVDFSYNGLASSTNGEGLMMRNGTQSTTYPIGMLTADETVMVGNVYNGFSISIITYLNISSGYYWTLSPVYFNYISQETANVFLVTSNGATREAYPVVLSFSGIRPSISLSINATITGEMVHIKHHILLII